MMENKVCLWYFNLFFFLDCLLLSCLCWDLEVLDEFWVKLKLNELNVCFGNDVFLVFFMLFVVFVVLGFLVICLREKIVWLLVFMSDFYEVCCIYFVLLLMLFCFLGYGIEFGNLILFLVFFLFGLGFVFFILLEDFVLLICVKFEGFWLFCFRLNCDSKLLFIVFWFCLVFL